MTKTRAGLIRARCVCVYPSVPVQERLVVSVLWKVRGVGDSKACAVRVVPRQTSEGDLLAEGCLQKG